ncbi:hypothetical protein MCSV2_20152 [Mucispirillum schaedleri ASF457]|nr:hypothetical protein MCSV2_20152 [Mucispirillum schaedleri ASF457]
MIKQIESHKYILLHNLKNFYLTMIKKSIINLNSNENNMVDVAQLVESRIVAPVVAGSSPVIHPY